jgi:hypothetical protein
MDAMTIEPAEINLLTATAIEPVLRIAAGRLPVMAFVDADTERLLQESSLLPGRNQIVRGGIAKAIDYLNEQRSPHVLLVDISGVDLPLSQIHILADVCEPGTRVIAIGDHNDVGLYRDLQEAGVSNYIVKPLTRELLAKALTPKTNSGDMGRAALKLGKMVSFVGARGGVGTTTLSANLAWHLATANLAGSLWSISISRMAAADSYSISIRLLVCGTPWRTRCGWTACCWIGL